MKWKTALVFGLLAAGVPGAAAALEGSAEMSATLVAQADPKKVELVMAVGCLAKGSGNIAWLLAKGTAPEPVRTAFTTQDELTASQKKPLGTMSYRLLGVAEFGVELHVGHKVQVKGCSSSLAAIAALT